MTEEEKKRDQEKERREAEERLAKRMGAIAHKVLVLSGKGGVGKSTVAVNLAVALHAAGKRTGLLDVDVHGPSVPRLLGLRDVPVTVAGRFGIEPVDADGIRVMSIGFMLRGEGEPVIWRGPMKHGVIKQFLGDVDWGKLDYLVIDAPPGTGDEPLSVCQLVPDADGAVVVTTPQELSVSDVRRSIAFCKRLGMRVLGVIENMSGLLCPKCGERIEVFGAGGGRRLAQETGVPFLGAVPLDPAVVAASDEGKPFVTLLKESAAAEAFSGIVNRLLETKEGGDSKPAAAGPQRKEKQHMRLAIPLAQGKLSLHFGHCESFALIDVEDGKVVRREDAAAPGHVPGLLPSWLAERAVDVIIAGGMGQRAQGLFAEHGIKVAIGAPSGEPEELVRSYLAGTLVTGENICDH